MPLPPAFEPVSFGALPGWSRDRLLPAFEAFRRSAFRVLEKPYRPGALGVTCDSLAPAFAAARDEPARFEAEARIFFERFFTPAFVRPDGGREKGLVTGFYEPEVEASPLRTERFGVPLLSRPADLVFARRLDDGTLAEYFDRAAIETGALSGRGLEIAWVADPVDAFFVHVQGAARLLMAGGGVRRVTYAAKSGQRFTGPGGVLAGLGEVPLEDVTMQSIRAWFRAHPERVREILHRNRSYIFFREAPVDDDSLGPVAAAKVPLTPGRSMAVDRLLHMFATPFFIHAPTLAAFGGGEGFARLMIAQDTGSAITGAARGDLFAGSGDAAGEIAGVVRHAADFFALLPREAAGA